MSGKSQSDTLQVLMTEHQRVLWDLHKRMELDGQIFIVQMAYIGAVSAFAITTQDVEFMKKYFAYIWFSGCTFSSVFFSAVLVEHSNNLFHSHVAAQYLFKVVRTQILEYLSIKDPNSGMLSWEIFLFKKRRSHASYNLMEMFGGRANIFLSAFLPFVALIASASIIYREFCNETVIAYIMTSVVLICAFLHGVALWIYVEAKKEFANLAEMVPADDVNPASG